MGRAARLAPSSARMANAGAEVLCKLLRREQGGRKRISTSSCRDLDLPSGWTSLRFPPRHRDLCRDDLIGVYRNRWGQWAEIELEVLGPHDVLLCSLTLIRWRP